MSKATSVSPDTDGSAAALACPASPPNSERFWVHLLVIALYSLIVIAFTWPLVQHLSDQSIGLQEYYTDASVILPFDRDQNIWNMWWFKKALFDFHINPYHTNYLYYPGGVDLYLQTMAPVNGIFGVLFYQWWGWLGAYNIMCLIIFVWCGHSAFVLANYLVQDKWCAFVAGIFFTLAPPHYYNLRLAQFHAITLQFLPLYLFYFLKLNHLRLEQPHWRQTLSNRQWWSYTFLAALFLVLSTLSDQYLLIFALVITGLYYGWQGLPLLWKKQFGQVLNLLARTIPALILAGLLLLPMAYKMVQVIGSGKWLEVSNEALPSDLVALFMPPIYNPFVGAWASGLGRAFPVQPDFNSQSIGLVGLVIAIYGIIRCKEARWWGLLLLVSTVLSLGGKLQLGKQDTGILLPSYWLNQLPLFQVMRFSYRWIGPATLIIAIVVAYTLHFHLTQIRASAQRFSRLKQTGLVLVVLAVFMFEAAPWPVPLTGNLGTLPKAYANNVLPKTDQRALLEVPFFQRKKFLAKSVEMYRQTAHERPILGGYISRPYEFDYNDTLLSYFMDGYNPDQPDFIKLEPSDLKAILAYQNFGYIVIYKDKLDPSVAEYWRKITVSMLGPETRPYYEDDELIFYQLPEQASVLPTKPVLIRGSGWSATEKLPDGSYYRWIIDQQATLPLFLPATQVGTQRLQFQVASYYRDRTIQVLVNDQPVTQFRVTPALQPYTLEIDSKWFKTGDNLITLRPLEPADRPADIEKTNDTRPLTILVNNLNFNPN